MKAGTGVALVQARDLEVAEPPDQGRGTQSESTSEPRRSPSHTPRSQTLASRMMDHIFIVPSPRSESLVTELQEADALPTN